MLQTSQESFLSELYKIFEIGEQSNKAVRVTIKRYDGRTKRNPRKPNDKPRRPSKSKSEQQQPAGEYKCLIRAKLGPKKVSAAIGQEDLDKFREPWKNCILGKITGLKKKQLQQPQQITSTSAPTTSATTTGGRK